MNKKAFLALNIFIMCVAVNTISSTIYFSKGASERKIVTESMKLGLNFEEGILNLFSLYDQLASQDVLFASTLIEKDASKIIAGLSEHQEAIYKVVIAPVYKQCKGKFRKVKRMVRSAHRDIKRKLKKAKKNDFSESTIERLKCRDFQLKTFLTFMKKNKKIMKSFWLLARLEGRYDKLIDCYQSLPNNEDPVWSEKFEEKLLLTSLESVNRFERAHLVVFFMCRYLSRDLKKCKKLYNKVCLELEAGFVTNSLNKKYNELSTIENFIKESAFYKEEEYIHLLYGMTISGVSTLYLLHLGLLAWG